MRDRLIGFILAVVCTASGTQAAPVAHSGFTVRPFTRVPVPGALALAVVPAGRSCLGAGVYVGTDVYLGGPTPDLIHAFDFNGTPLPGYPVPSLPDTHGIIDLQPGPHGPFPDGLWASVRACTTAASVGRIQHLKCDGSWEIPAGPDSCNPPGMLNEPFEIGWDPLAGTDGWPDLLYIADGNWPTDPTPRSMDVGTPTYVMDPPPWSLPNPSRTYNTVSFPFAGSRFTPGLYSTRRDWFASQDCTTVNGDVVRFDPPIAAELTTAVGAIPPGYGEALWTRFAPVDGCFGGDLYISALGFEPGPSPCASGGAIFRMDPTGKTTRLVDQIASMPRPVTFAFAPDGRALYFIAAGEGMVYVVELGPTGSDLAIKCPADISVECGAPTDPTSTGSASCSGGCSPSSLRVDPDRLSATCGKAGRIERTFTCSDGLVSRSCTQQIEVLDRTAPVWDRFPPDASASCAAVPPRRDPIARDACDDAPVVVFDGESRSGSCPDTYALKRCWRAQDDCGNRLGPTCQTTQVSDTTAPGLLGVPRDLDAECEAVPRPPVVTAVDDCDPTPVIGFTERRFDGGCPGQYRLERTWTAADRCGNAHSETRQVHVEDRQPPVVTPREEELACVWPPDHKMVCFDAADFSPEIRDACSEPVTWRLTGCASDQPELGPGRRHEADCVVDPDGGRLCVRAERDGSDPGGRRYTVTVTAQDACGNRSAETGIGHLHVPHDASPGRSACIRP